MRKVSREAAGVARFFSGLRWALPAILVLTACGGGGGGSEDLTQGEFSGTAAMGEPVAGGTLELRCASGTRSATTGPDGRYRVELEKSLQLPCVIFVRGGTVAGQPNRESMAGVLLRLGAVANVTPWTHLVAARLLGGEPNNTVPALPSGDLANLLTEAKLAVARAFVREQLAKVLGNPPAEDIDPVATPFEARPGNGMDDLIGAIYSGLQSGGKNLGLAAQEMALNGLEMYYVPRTCRAGVLTGFTGTFNDVLVQAPYRPPPSGALGGADSYGGTAGDDSGGGGEGAGVGGSLGQFLRTKVEVRRADGSLLGTATTDNDKGMVTLVKCDYRGPLRITLRGERDDATYYDESRKSNVSFAGRSMCAVLPGMTKNIGVTPLTNAACAYLDELVKDRPPVAGRAPWADDELIEKANAAALKAYNDHAGPNFRLDDITRLPVVIGQQLDQQQGVLPFDQNGIYAAVLAGLVQSAGRYDPDSPSPALAFTDQIARDLTDGTLDHRTAQQQSAFGNGTPAYLIDQLPMQARSDTSGNALRLGDEALRLTGSSVIKSVFIAQYHREPYQVPPRVGWPVNYSATVAMRADGTVTFRMVRDPDFLERVEYPELVSPAGVRMVDFRVAPHATHNGYSSTPTKIIAFSDKGEVYTVTGLENRWTLAFGVQRKVVDVIGGPYRLNRQLITLTSDGRVTGDEVETKLPAGVRFEAIAELSGTAFLLVDAGRRLNVFYTDPNRNTPSGQVGHYASLTPFSSLRVKMTGGKGSLFFQNPGNVLVGEGTLLVLDLSGGVWMGGVSVDPAAAGTATRITGLDGDTCFIHRWFAVGCKGALVSLHDPTRPLTLTTPLLPGLARIWRTFNGEQVVGGDEVTRAVSYEGCLYEIRYAAVAGWMVTPDTTSRQRSACVSPLWSGDPIVFVR